MRSPSRVTMLAGFLVGLHALAVLSLLRQSDGRIAEGVVLLSSVPVALAVAYLLRVTAAGLTWLDIWVLLYAGWSVVSGVLYLQPGNPTRPAAYWYGLYHFVLPIACYLAAKSCPKERQRHLVSAIVLLNALAIGYGVYLHFARPDYYRNFVVRVLTPQGATEDWQFFARMQSYLGSTSVGYIGAVGVVLVSLATAGVRRWLFPLASLFALGSALSLQRASFVGTALGLGYLLLFSIRQRWSRILLAGSFAALAIYGTIRLQASSDPLLGRLLERATWGMTLGLSEFAGERGYAIGARYLELFPMGVGIGATSSAATNAGLAEMGQVVDANFMRVAADLGIVGAVLWLMVLAAAGWRAARSRQRAAWWTFLAIHCGIMLSTNIFDSFYISHSFWLLLGVLDGDSAGDSDERLASPDGFNHPAASESGLVTR